MNIEHLDRVNKLVKIKKRCLESIDGLHAYLEIAEARDDCGGTDGYTQGYGCHFSEYSDNSGNGADMSGCYVGVQAANALLTVLDEQVSRVDADLQALGVELGRLEKDHPNAPRCS